MINDKLIIHFDYVHTIIQILVHSKIHNTCFFHLYKNLKRSCSSKRK